MPIPRNRDDLVSQIQTSYRKLEAELAGIDEPLSTTECVDDWTMKDVLAVRVWWSEAVVEWTRRGQRGETPVTPASGFKWSETPRLNAKIIRSSQGQSYDQLRARLARAVRDVLATIDQLDDVELLEVGVHRWAGKWPLSRWFSINTARQYTTARTYFRRVTKGAAGTAIGDRHDRVG